MKKIVSFMLVLCFLTSAIGIGYSVDFFSVGNHLMGPITNVIDKVTQSVQDYINPEKANLEGQIYLIRIFYPTVDNERAYYIDLGLEYSMPDIFTLRQKLNRNHVHVLLYYNYPSGVVYNSEGWMFMRQYQLRTASGDVIGNYSVGTLLDIAVIYTLPSYDYYLENVKLNPDYIWNPLEW